MIHMHISYFSFLVLAFVFSLLLARVFITANSVRPAQVLWLYKETLEQYRSIAHCLSSYYDQVYRSFCDGLSSEYYTHVSSQESMNSSHYSSNRSRSRDS